MNSDIIELSIKVSLSFFFFVQNVSESRVLCQTSPLSLKMSWTAQNEIRIPGTSAKDGTQVTFSSANPGDVVVCRDVLPNWYWLE